MCASDTFVDNHQCDYSFLGFLAVRLKEFCRMRDYVSAAMCECVLVTHLSITISVNTVFLGLFANSKKFVRMRDYVSAAMCECVLVTHLSITISVTTVFFDFWL